MTSNILGAKWSKLVVNSMTMGPYTLLGLKNWEAAALPGMTEISVRIGRESVAVGEELGYRLEPIFGMSAEQFSGEGDEMLVRAIRVLHGHIGKDDHGHGSGPEEGSPHRAGAHHRDGGPQRPGGWCAHPSQRRRDGAGT